MLKILSVGFHDDRGPVRRFKDVVKVNSQKCHFGPPTLSSDSQDRVSLENFLSRSSYKVLRMAIRRR